MARSKSSGNGRVDRLEEGMAALSQAQANLVQAQANLVQANAALAQQHTLFLGRMAETDARMAETGRINSERFARIEAILTEMRLILREHDRVLAALPDAIRDKIGFKSPPSPKAAE